MRLSTYRSLTTVSAPLYKRSIHSSSIISQSFQEIIKKQESHNEVPKEIISGTPQELVTERIVRIYKESKPATQSGNNGMWYFK